MSITKDSEGFTKATMHSANQAQFHAQFDDDGKNSEGFFTSFEPGKAATTDGWYFDEPACREAAEFFNMLGDEAARRKEGDK